MDMQSFLATVQKYAGSAEAVAERAARKTLEVLGELLTHRDREVLARDLPDDLREPLFARSNGSGFDRDTFYEKVIVQENANRSFHLEHAQAVCTAVTETVDSETAQRVRTRLPDSIAELFEPRDIPTADRSRRDVGAGSRKLSSGRPGSSRPISEADSKVGHRNSVVSRDNPHGNRKLSTGQGARDLASGKAAGDVAGERDDV